MLNRFKNYRNSEKKLNRFRTINKAIKFDLNDHFLNMFKPFIR